MYLLVDHQPEVSNWLLTLISRFSFNALYLNIWMNTDRLISSFRNFSQFCTYLVVPLNYHPPHVWGKLSIFIDNHMISSAIGINQQSARAKNRTRQFVVFERFTKRIMWLIVNNKQGKIGLFFLFGCFFFRLMAHWLGGLPLPCCLSNRAFPFRTCFKLLNSRSRATELWYSFSNRYQSTAVTITRNCQARNFSRLSYELSPKISREFVQGLRLYFYSRFWEPQTSRVLASCFCHVGRFCSFHSP